MADVHNLRLGIDGGDWSLAVKCNCATLGIGVAVVIVVVAREFAGDGHVDDHDDDDNDDNEDFKELSAWRAL